MDNSLDEVIASRPRPHRGAGRRGGAAAKAQLLESTDAHLLDSTDAHLLESTDAHLLESTDAHLLESTDAHPAIATTKVAPSSVAPPPADTTIVTDLPGDVNEVQIKAC
ncbi:hypothetical protein M405DRAFT_933515 [Rhizopogon salebrosus TDB-379]|nr:hypothetical protein M405DRAFT_933515 [Rhizopogon salebrosus TDB-379]